MMTRRIMSRVCTIALGISVCIVGSKLQGLISTNNNKEEFSALLSWSSSFFNNNNNNNNMAMSFLRGSSSMNHRFLKADTVFVNDLYHCFLAVSETTASMASNFTDDTVDCDFSTLEWNFAEFNPNTPPARCVNYVPSPLDVKDSNDDLVEPCVWWHMLYGDLRTTQSPSTAPTLTETPTNEPTTSPTLFPTTIASSSPSYNIRTSPNRPLTDFTLTLTLPDNESNTKSNNNNRHDRSMLALTEELVQITADHLKNFFEFSLGLTILLVDLKSPVAEFTTSYFLNEFEGSVYFEPESVIPSPETLDLLVTQAFEGRFANRFLRALKETDIALLQSAEYVELSLDDNSSVSSSTNQAGSQQSNNPFAPNFEWSLAWIVIVAGGGAGILAVLILTFLLCSARGDSKKNKKNLSRATMQELKGANSHDTPNTAVIDSPTADDNKKTKKSNKATAKASSVALAAVAVPGAAAAAAGHDGVSDMDASSDYNFSDTTSLYSYKQHDDSSVAPSVLHGMDHPAGALGSFYDGDDESLLLWNPLTTSDHNPSSSKQRTSKFHQHALSAADLMPGGRTSVGLDTDDDITTSTPRPDGDYIAPKNMDLESFIGLENAEDVSVMGQSMTGDEYTTDGYDTDRDLTRDFTQLWAEEVATEEDAPKAVSAAAVGTRKRTS